MRAAPPLDPSSPEARQWLEDELRKGMYHEQPGLLERLWAWLVDLLSSTGSASLLPSWTIWLVALAGIAVVAVILVRTLRAERRMTGPRREGVLDGPVRSAAEHRALAREALAVGDHDTAVLEGYRAIARAAVERTVLDDLPGRTAHEVAVQLGPVFPPEAARLAGAADAFDAVRYGRRPATDTTGREVVALDEALVARRPVLPDAPGGLVVTP